MVNWELQEGKYVRDPRLGHRFGINFRGYLEESNSSINTFQLSTDEYGFIHNGENSIRQYPLNKNSNDKIIIIGGSLAMGLGASNNESTLAAQLEKLINKDNNKKIDVINAACGGYCSWHSVIKLSMELIRLKPIAVIDISGWNDMLHSSWGAKNNGEWLENHDRSIEDVFISILDAQKKISFIDRLKYRIKKSKAYLTLKRFLLITLGKSYSIQDISWGHENNNLKFRKNGIINFINNLKTLNGICIAHNIKFIHLLQPNPIWIRNSKRDDTDKVSLDINLHLHRYKNFSELSEKYLSSLKKFYMNNNFNLKFFIDLSDNSDFLLEDWHDHCHLSDKGQLKLANYIFNNYYDKND